VPVQQRTGLPPRSHPQRSRLELCQACQRTVRMDKSTRSYLHDVEIATLTLSARCHWRSIRRLNSLAGHDRDHRGSVLAVSAASSPTSSSRTQHRNSDIPVSRLRQPTRCPFVSPPCRDRPIWGWPVHSCRMVWLSSSATGPEPISVALSRTAHSVGCGSHDLIDNFRDRQIRSVDDKCVDGRS
jgi:hypothetical protein